MNSDLVIIGAGPAGLSCAIAASARGLSVTILEKNDAPGKKLLLSGTGQCNISHTGPIEDFLDHYGGKEKGRFIKPALFHFTNRDLFDFFAEHGIWLVEANDGKLFPESRKSRDVLDVLLSICERQKVVLRTGTAAIAVEARDSLFYTTTKNGTHLSQALVIATGGQSYPSTGSSGDGFRFAASLGHTITPIRSGLAPVIPTRHSLADCSGIAVENAGISLFRSGKAVQKTRGDVLITHRGFSGPGILDFSRFLFPGDRIRFQWTGTVPTDECEKHIAELLLEKGKGKRTLKRTLVVFGLPERLILGLLHEAKIDPEQEACQIEKGTRKTIAALLSSYEITVGSLGGFSEAMCTCGGVALEEINRNRLESRLVPNLFFCGEVLDIDGDCGGYNLQFAISSGLLVGSRELSIPV